MSPRKMPAKRLLHFLLILTIAACTRVSSGSPDLSPESASPRQQTYPDHIPGSSKTWTMASTAIPRHYTSVITTILEFLTDSGVIHETIIVRTGFTFSLSPSSLSSLFTVIVDELSVERGVRIGVMAQLPVLPFSFTGRVIGNGFVVEKVADQSISETPACTSSTMSTVTSILHTMPVVPTIVTVGDTWTDSSSISTCSGVIPTTLTAVRHYRVFDEVKHGETETILIERTDKDSFMGEGSQNQHRIIVAGQGMGSSRLYLDPTTGHLKNAVGEYRTTLTIVSSGRSQRFTQVVRETTTLSPN